MRRLRIMRIVERLAVSGTAAQVTALMRGLDPDRFHQRLYAGPVESVDEDGDGDYRRLRAADVPVHHVPELGRRGPRADLRALAALTAAVRDFQPDIVHTHGPRAGVLGRLASVACRTPVRVHTVHGPAPATTRWAARTERFLGRLTDSLVVADMEARESLLAAGVGQPDRYAVVPPGASLRPLPARRQARLALGLTGPGPVVAYVGRLSARRRPDRLLDVVRRLRLIVPEVRIVVCGAGERRAATVAEAVSDGLDITFLPWRSDVETVYAAADVIVLTSDEEGVPMCLIEAGLAGRPVVATDVGGVAEVVRHGTTGLLCEPYAADLTQAVADLLRDRGLRRRMGRAALAETGRRFGTPRLLAATRDLYTRLAVHRGWWSLPQVEFVPVLPTDPAVLTPSGPHAYGRQP